MTFRRQLQWGGLAIILAALLVSVTNGLLYVGIHTIALHVMYAIGFAGLILTCTLIHITQARRASLFESIIYLLSVLCLAYVNVAIFMDLVAMADIPGTEQAIASTRGPVFLFAMYVLYFCLVLFFLVSAQVGAIPRWAAILTAFGIALQLPAQFAMNMAGPMFFPFSAGGSILFGVGLVAIGWSLWSNTELLMEDPHLSTLDRGWGAPIVMLAALFLILNAYTNTFSALRLSHGIINLISLTILLLSITILFIVQAKYAGITGWLGFVFIHLGAALSIIPAYLIMAQLAGQIESSRALTAAWVDFPFGRVGNYMLILGMILFGVSVIRANVFPRWTGWLVVIGVALFLPSQFQSQADLFIIFWAIGATFAGIGFGYMGWTLLRQKSSFEQA
ncbi:MAG TPA: hypothetical protein VKP08_17480 [Anaerolineales bacterium]|nr:hypothetical protein [Anaerolineales bacterium]